MTPPVRPPRTGNLPEWAKARPSSPGVAPREAWSVGIDRSTALLGAGAVLLLVVVAFGVGFQVAQKTTTRRLDEKYKAQISDIIRNLTETKPAAAAGNADPRIANLNYLRLCQVPAEEGEKLARFLATKGHRTLRLPVGKAPQLVTLYAINQAFEAGQRAEMEQFRAELRHLGDQWAKQNKGGNPFRSMMLEKYTP